MQVPVSKIPQISQPPSISARFEQQPQNNISFFSFLFFFSFAIQAALEQLTKPDHYGNQSSNATSVSGNGASATYQTYTNKSANVYQAPNPQQGYTNSNYANTQVSNSSNYSSSTNTYNAYNQVPVNSYQTQQSNLTNSVNNSSSVTNVSNSGSTVGSTSSVNNAR